MTYRCFQNGKLLNGIFENKKTISRVYRDRTLVWQAENEDPYADKLVFYAKDGTVVTYDGNEISGIVYTDTQVWGEPSQKTNCLAYISANPVEETYDPGDIFKASPPYSENPHLCHMSVIMSDNWQISADTPALSVIDNTNALSTVPSYGFTLCYDLEYVKSDGIKRIGMASFFMYAGF